MSKNNFSSQIKHIREKHNMSQQQFGSLIGVSNRAVSKWENGISNPTASNLARLSKIFNISPAFFYDGEITEVLSPEKEISGMESLTELYKIGCGPSSSHTMGPEKACRIMKEKFPQADRFEVRLFGSLAKTGKGHCTDEVIKKTLYPVWSEIKFDYLEENIKHPNTMDILAFEKHKLLAEKRVYSIGGGKIVFEGEKGSETEAKIVYKEHTFKEIADYCKEKKIRLWQYCLENENPDFMSYMKTVWETMKDTLEKGLEDEGILPGGLNVVKKAKQLYNTQHIDETPQTHENRLVCAYAFATGEQNASGQKIVTSPTCGAAGVVPAVLYYYQGKNGYNDDQIIRALITAGLIGNLIKTNASISGAECGCQVEVGSACAMAAAALAELFELNIDKIEYAAEIAIEHHLGLTCDPICGLVQIPCIERNAVAAMRAINCVNLASFLWDTRKISFDKVVIAMKETGHDMSSSYKETSEAGLAKIEL